MGLEMPPLRKMAKDFDISFSQKQVEKSCLASLDHKIFDRSGSNPPENSGEGTPPKQWRGVVTNFQLGTKRLSQKKTHRTKVQSGQRWESLFWGGLIYCPLVH